MYIFPEEIPKNLFTEAEDFKAYKILFSSVLTTSDMGFFLNLKSLWEACRGLGEKQKLPGYKVIQWYPDLHFFKSFFLAF